MFPEPMTIPKPETTRDGCHLSHFDHVGSEPTYFDGSTRSDIQRTRQSEGTQLLLSTPQSQPVLPRLRADRRLVSLVVGSAVLQGLLLMPVPLVIRDVFDEAIPNQDSTRLIVSGIGLIMLVTLSGGISTLLRHLTIRIVQSHVADVRIALAGHLVAAPLPALQDATDETIRDVSVQDTLRYSSAISTVTTHVLPSVVAAIMVAAVLTVIDPLMMALSTVLVLPLIVLHRTLGRSVRHDVDAYHNSFRSFGSGVTRMNKRAPVTRVHGAQHLELALHQARTDDLRETSHIVDRTRSIYTWAMQSVIVGAALGILVIGGLGVVRGHRTLGELFAFYAAIALIRPALDVSVQAAPTIAAGRLARQRLDDLADLDLGDDHWGSTQIDFAGSISVESAGFAHGDRQIFENISFTLEPGTVTLLRGPNGSGKTTLVRLLCGLLQPTQGCIRADGIDYHELDLITLRRSIGVVFQEALVAGESIAEALAYGDHEADDAAIDHAVEVTGFDTVLDRLTDGIHTRIGEGGITLSGGERQRLAIAQALVRRPRLLLLDEPTNHLDATAVAAVVAELVGRPDGPAVLVVTHEDSRRFQPDQIIELTSQHSATAGVPT
ncbi:MAG: ABC-type bacteriocin/lantibiotic exporter with double-glycine peptidase domain [Acidimicrobiales bacterium]|jgi:ABC-type bacteriocin/lantibiotic exporter with double-glycine peptidase domain